MHTIKRIMAKRFLTRFCEDHRFINEDKRMLENLGFWHSDLLDRDGTVKVIIDLRRQGPAYWLLSERNNQVGRFQI